MHLWKVVLKEQLLTAGTSTYATPSDCSDVLEAYVSTALTITETTNDISLDKIDRSAYAALPNKGQTGQPSQYYVNRQINPTISLYLTPDCAQYIYLKYYYISRIQDAGAYNDQANVPYRFLPCMISGLAYYLGQKVSPDRVQGLKLIYEDELQRALEEDSQRTSSYISPYSYFGDGI